MDAIFGRRLASSEKEGVKIGVAAGVPAMGLDALSSAAYGPEAALTILLPLGVAGLAHLLPITLVILVLLTILYFSYRQTVAAYPSGGGSYIVATENLGTWPGLLAAAALLVDYLLNVAVGISAGVAALVSAYPPLHHYTLPMCLAVLTLITVLNLRGTGEAGTVFAIPTYVFILSMVAVIAVGCFRSIVSGGHPHPAVKLPPIAHQTEAVGLWLLLRAFASGCTAMTGVEAVSNGVAAFKDPPIKLARRTLTLIVVVLGLFLAGIAYLARVYQIDAMDQSKPGYQSVLSQLFAAVVGRNWLYYICIASVLMVLCLSANTSFVDFPRVCRLIASNDFLPRAFANLGRRLVYAVGVLVLAVSAGVLLAVFDGITDKLIPLFAVGAFLAFTLSQAGMVVHWWRELRNKRSFASVVRLIVNAAGAIATGIALVIILAAKFVEGAWIVTLLIPLQLVVFHFVHRYYSKLSRQTDHPSRLNLDHNQQPIVLIPVRGCSKLTDKALRFAMWMSSDIHALHLSNLSGEEAKEEDRRVRDEWATNVEAPAREHGTAVPTLEMVSTPYRSFLEPLLKKIDELKEKCRDRPVAVVIPQVIRTRWWQVLLHSNKPNRLRAVLLKRGDHHVIVIEVPWYLQE
jgi:amino acid transporter